MATPSKLPKLKRSKPTKTVSSPAKRKWKEVKVEEKHLYSNDMSGFVCLEELKDYSESDFIGRKDAVAKFDTAREGPKKKKSKRSNKMAKKGTQATEKNVKKENENVNEEDEIKSDHEEEQNEWTQFGVPNEISKALLEKGFNSLTPIQEQSLPAAIHHWQDIIGAAETGSGKTLAFGIPILTRILELKTANKNNKDKSLLCLILAPTRELALQVCQHIKDAAKYCDIQCVSIVGGLSTQKQERLLGRSPEIVVATPGRLNSLLKDGDSHLAGITSVPLFAIDEVDRMLEHGHFKDLTDILEIMQQDKTKRQTFIFSATLSLPKYHSYWAKASVQKGGEMQKLMDKLKINAKAKVVDLTKKNVTASGLNQWRILCSLEEKDLYLYYFLILHPGRTLVFVNSINSARRLCSIFAILGRKPHQLHAGKQQKQRLKALSRFTSDEHGLLVATDVAARGLDIKNVDHVVHYQLPKDPSIYVHRSGRTARANSNGQSLILESSEDFQAYKKICEVLKLPSGITTFPVDHLYLLQMKKRLDLARRIDKEQHVHNKEVSKDSWMTKTAKSLDIELDADQELENEKNAKKKTEQKNIHNLKAQLDALLKLPILPRGFSGSYPTVSGGLQKQGLSSI